MILHSQRGRLPHDPSLAGEGISTPVRAKLARSAIPDRAKAARSGSPVSGDPGACGPGFCLFDVFSRAPTGTGRSACATKKSKRAVHSGDLSPLLLMPLFGALGFVFHHRELDFPLHVV